MPHHGDHVACQRERSHTEAIASAILFFLAHCYVHPRTFQAKPSQCATKSTAAMTTTTNDCGGTSAAKSHWCPHHTPTIAMSLCCACRFNGICTSMHLQGQEGSLRRGYTELVEGTQWGRDVSLLASLVWMAKDSLIVYCCILAVLC
ncbi:uncharacterized protein LACBIDRAFT_308939 [Laccaria bicolor S238N-H82]|uniref:Predicted protein n=1 Tax=Laccaria bicolor (strain S238N-H82 / ATCC MYA-4686) TaxID=486041 RepID=B0CV51_LACBS|nr:uncharacterized protein LACBIDRAFT_308939 [Laccaria bicolor S238N-H82]EDR13268.1 predicted protein [Laccaria bicolor S238N-H82]|eukprot:XP_001875766.1 predicted protein [Laccaria bicolor S238N-H82]